MENRIKKDFYVIPHVRSTLCNSTKICILTSFLNPTISVFEYGTPYNINSPDLMSLVAMATLTTHGIPYSLATTAPVKLWTELTGNSF